MKNVMMLILSTMFAVCLAGCGNAASGPTQEVQENAEQTAETPSTENDSAKEPVTEEPVTEEPVTEESEKSETGSGAGKTLVVYYSATGNTKAVAEVIAEQTSGDLFELIPTEQYTKEDLDWTVADSRVSVEHDNPDKRAVALEMQTVDNWDDYDTVYIGYPIWWGIAAWPVDTFIKANDFTGKTVIPFATAASSGFGQSGEYLQEMTGTGEWLYGECFRGSASDEEILAWVDAN